MDKPLVLRIEELKHDIVIAVETAQLPASVVSMVLGQFLTQAEYQSQVELQEIAKAFEKANEEALQKEEATKEE